MSYCIDFLTTRLNDCFWPFPASHLDMRAAAASIWRRPPTYSGSEKGVPVRPYRLSVLVSFSGRLCNFLNLRCRLGPRRHQLPDDVRQRDNLRPGLVLLVQRQPSELSFQLKSLGRAARIGVC